jgi:hypothetical protein
MLGTILQQHRPKLGFESFRVGVIDPARRFGYDYVSKAAD